MIPTPLNGAQITLEQGTLGVEINIDTPPQLLERPECIEMELIKILRKLSKKNIFIN